MGTGGGGGYAPVVTGEGIGTEGTIGAALATGGFLGGNVEASGCFGGVLGAWRPRLLEASGFHRPQFSSSLLESATTVTIFGGAAFSFPAGIAFCGAFFGAGAFSGGSSGGSTQMPRGAVSPGTISGGIGPL